MMNESGEKAKARSFVVHPGDGDVSANPYTLSHLDRLYGLFARNPDAVSAEWRAYFESVGGGNGHHEAAVRPAVRPVTADHDTGFDTNDPLTLYYRANGHLFADVNPLTSRAHARDAGDDLPPWIDGSEVSSETDDTVHRLRACYCGPIGAQFMHLGDGEARAWIAEQMEACAADGGAGVTDERRRRILRRLTDATVFEEFLAKRFVGAKTFGIEGAESLVPMLDETIRLAGEQGVAEIVIGMAHRGRLNVLRNVLDKPAAQIFREFEDMDPKLYLGGGDVKYHLGHSSNRPTSKGHDVHLSLCFNPSHLEFINPVAMGRVRAKQDRTGDEERRRGMTLLIHGDAAVAAEGVVGEAMNLCRLDAYDVGGTLHVVINNQLGFTTPPGQGRSTRYCTDIALMYGIPVFHVNADEPEAVVRAMDIAMGYRVRFRHDAVVDLVCYRRRGHNEADEPSFTQPQMYRKIESHPSVLKMYTERLIERDLVSGDEAESIAEEIKANLEEAYEKRESIKLPPRTGGYGGVWEGYLGGWEHDIKDPDTGVSEQQLVDLLTSIASVPEGFEPHRKIRKGMERRLEMAEGEAPLDWPTAEAMAIASLAVEGHRVRLTGQDCERGTFSQRHAVLHDVAADAVRTHGIFSDLSDDQAPVEVRNSPLCEAAVMGFEYGYSLDCPHGLIMWEAQFGDFANAAQVYIDQFLASAEDKWNRLSGIVLLLPHGFEGQGPEHASARLERFLMLSAEHNIQVVVPTTPAQYFHVLRRQVVRKWRKPLVVLTPKSLLRHPRCVSDLGDLTEGRFRRVIGDPDGEQQDEIERVLLCTGKIYYEMLKRREELGRDDVSIVRVEQLYPFPANELREALTPYADGTPVFWVQEEPQNMGAWPYLCPLLGCQLFDRLPFAAMTRPESASPATGSHAAHDLEQDQLLSRAFGGDIGDPCDRHGAHQ